MKKSFILLPLSALILTACSSNSAPVVSATGSSELSPGVMQPVAGTGAVSSGWQTGGEVQQAEMPSSMSGAAGSAVSAPPAVQPQAQEMNPSITEQPAEPQTTTKTVTRTKTVEKKVNQNFEIPRDSNNAPLYSQIQKGFYDGPTYTVRKGDTMFLIAYIVGKDVKEIAALNNMKEPYHLTVGQKLKTGKTATETVTVEEKVTVPVEPKVTYQQGAHGTTYASDGNITGPIKASTGSAASGTGVVASAGTATGVRATTGSSYSTSTSPAPVANFQWQWPTTGRIVSGFSAADGGNKGIDIAGNKGQDIKAAAAGKVVYAGNALEGYGNLIIIKHSDDFLSAYAHNDSIRVKEQDNVKAGQTIARMGSTGTNTNKLHFEIRYKGKSVDPTRYLPRR